MQTVTIHLGVLVALVTLIGLLIIILVFVFIRSCYIKPHGRESDEVPLKPLPFEMTPPNSALDEVPFQAPSHQCKRPHPVIALAAGSIVTARSWMARRGVGQGFNVDSWAGDYDLTLDTQPNDRVDGAILLHDLSEVDRDKWKQTSKPVMVEGEDPAVENEGWAPSLTYPFRSLLAMIIGKAKVVEREVV
jgi:hypothetical protein